MTTDEMMEAMMRIETCIQDLQMMWHRREIANYEYDAQKNKLLDRLIALNERYVNEALAECGLDRAAIMEWVRGKEKNGE